MSTPTPIPPIVIPPVAIIPPYIPPYAPVSNITPFTYRDGATYLQILEALRQYINKVIVPFVNTEFAELGDIFVEEINRLIDAVNDAIDLVINSSVELQDPVMAGIIADLESETRTLLDELYASVPALETETAERIAADDAEKIARIQATGLNVKEYGAVGDGTTDDTAAIKAAITAATAGQTIIFPNTGSGAGYLVSETLIISKPNIRFLGEPRDSYAVSIRCDVATIPIIRVNAPGFVFEDLGIWGDSDRAGASAGSNGEGGTNVGLEIFGDVNGNGDAAIRGATFQYLALGINNHSRNVEVSGNTLFSNCLNGYRHSGIDAIYHDALADSNRGNVISDSRFHNIGTTEANIAVEFATGSNLTHCIIQNNHFDSHGYGRDIVINGTSNRHATGASINDNKHTERHADVIVLDWVDISAINGEVISGYQDSVRGGNGIVLTNCIDVQVTGIFMQLVEKSAVKIRTSSRITVSDGHLRGIGTGTATAYDAFDIDAASSDIRVANVNASSGVGWFYTGSPIGTSTVTNCTFTNFTKGGVNSDTVVNISGGASNRYAEGRHGRISDEAVGHYTLEAGVSKNLATILTGLNFGGIILEVDIAGRASTGNAYFSGKRYVRPENGAGVVVVLGTDVATSISASFTISGQNVILAASSAAAQDIGVRVRAIGGGAPGPNAALRNTVINMVPQT